MKLKILAFAAALTLATNLSAQTFTILHSFTYSDGAEPWTGLTLSGSTLYGTTLQGGSSGSGTVFKMNTEGNNYTVLKNFNALSDGSGPSTVLVLSGNTLYGATCGGVNSSSGTIFKVNTDGTGFTNLYSFSATDTNGVNSDGASPIGLTLADGTLYGAAALGGSRYGTLFKVNIDGTGFTVLVNFDYVNGYIPNDLALSGSTLYGTTFYGGRWFNDRGSVFKVNTDGTGFATINSFTSSYYGENPGAGLVVLGSTLYGTTQGGGSGGSGTIFKINTDRTGYTVLHNFTALDSATNTNNDGAGPAAVLKLSGSTLYGTTQGGGSGGSGTIFSINTGGSAFASLYSFSATFTNSNRVYTNGDGANPRCALVLSGDTLYGTTLHGGSSGNGTVFALSLAPFAPIIKTQPQSQTTQAGCNVAFTVVASGLPSPNYQWQFNGQKLAGQTAASLSLTNVQFGNAGGYSVVVTNAYGSVTSAVAQLTVFTNLVVAQTNKAPPPPGKPTIPTDATHFKVFTNGGFVTGIGLDASKSTIVITHGWNINGSADCSSGWPLEMANDIKLELGAGTPNIVAWDWSAAASGPLATATLNTQGQGYALGEDLAAALGANYSQHIHFIGHSLGTLVNARAANYIHTNGFSWTNTQMTLFDDAEVAWGLMGNSWATLTSLLENDSSPQQDWKHPLPDHCGWADNYITAVGFPHPLAVNVILTNLAPDLRNIQNLFDFGIGIWKGQFVTEITDYHEYPYIWYFNTVNQINNPNDPPYLMGFSRSWEGGGSAGRPSTNTYYIESLNCPPSFPSYSGYDPAYNLVQITSDQANQYLNARPQNLISQVGVNLVSSSANILANNNNQQVQLLNGPAVSASSQITGPAYAFATLIKLFTTSLINGSSPNGPIRPMDGSPTNSPAYVWIPVTVPSNALTMAFNFMLQGNGKQDSFQVALNSNDLMTVETVLIQTNVTMSSGMIDVSQYAGQQAELFFGIVGGTSTNASVTVSDIAFYVTLPPSLRIQLAGTNVVLTWPLSATGYVLQSANQVTPPVSWTTVTNVPVIVNFQYTVTNQISSGSRYYRLAIIAAPTLQAQVSGNNFILSWPASASGYVLEATTNLAAANSWLAVTNTPATVNQQSVVTNQISGAAKFYRLKQQ
jgi:uncharacterized repeat protein (TIGR03803 family)